MSARIAADLERELAMLAIVRDRLRASEGDDVGIPTIAVDEVLDELGSLARSPRTRNRSAQYAGVPRTQRRSTIAQAR